MAKVSPILLFIGILTCRPALVLSQDTKSSSFPSECNEYIEPQGPNTVLPKPPRVFPFCVGPDPQTQRWPSKIKDLGFDQIIEKINAQSIVSYDPSAHFLYEDKSQAEQV